MVMPFKSFIGTLPESVSPPDASRLYADYCRAAGANPSPAGASAIVGMQPGYGGGYGGAPPTGEQVGSLLLLPKHAEEISRYGYVCVNTYIHTNMST